jgi:hypothetical protein
LSEEACAGKPQAGFCEGETHNDARLNLVALSIPKGERNGEYKASLNIGGVLSTRRLNSSSAYNTQSSSRKSCADIGDAFANQLEANLGNRKWWGWLAVSIASQQYADCHQYHS